MRNYPELYAPYNQILIDELNIDWFQLRDTAIALGNGPGLYPDTAACLSKVVQMPNIKTILELGSGSSSIYLSKACSIFDKKLVSIEESGQYRCLTESLLEACKINQKILLLNEVDFSQLDCPDLIFLDSDSKSRAGLLSVISNSKWCAGDVQIIMLDDAEDVQYSVPVMRNWAQYGRYNNWLFNPIGRQDRSLLMNNSDVTFNFNEWFWTWKPDKVYW